MTIRLDHFFSFSIRRFLLLAFLAALGQSVLLTVIVGYGRGIGTDGAFYALSGYNLFHGLGFTYSDVPNTFTWPLLSILTGFLSLFVDDLQVCMHIVLTLAFAAGVLPFYGLVKNLLGGRAARIATLLYVLNGFLMRMSTRMTAESLLVFFVVLSAYFMSHLVRDVREQRRTSPWTCAGAGLSLGLAYLTKPEGILFFVFPVVFLGVFLIRRDSLKTSLWKIAVLAGLFILTIAPQVLFVHKVTGKWQLTTYNRFLFRGYVEPWVSLSPGEPAVDRRVENNYNAYIVRGPYTDEQVTKDLRSLPLHFENYFLSLWVMIGPLSLLLLAVSFFLPIWKNGPRGLVYSFLFPMLPFCLWYNTSGRFYLVFLPFVLIVAVYVVQQMNVRLKNRSWGSTVVLTALFMVAVMSFRPISYNSPTNAVIGNHALMGKWIRRYLPEMKGKLLADRKPYVAFEAHALYYRYDRVPDYASLIRRLNKNHVDYLIVDDFYTRTKNPGVIELLDGLDTADLKFIHREEDETWGAIILYELKKDVE